MKEVMLATNLRRNFGNFTAVDGVDLVLRAGTITGLIGSNGAGKTTLMLMLAGMLAPDTGEIKVLGEDFSAHPRISRARIGWLPDSFGLWGALSVKEIMVDFARLYGLNRSAAVSRADELLKIVHLENMAQSHAHLLSRGQKQRLGVARTLIHHPALLILDEPAAGMDPRSRIELREVVRAQADSGVAVLVSSHVLSELDNLIDEALFMESGKIIQTSIVENGVREKEKMQRYRVRVLDGEEMRVRAVLAEAGAQKIHVSAEKSAEKTSNMHESIEVLLPQEYEVLLNSEQQAAHMLSRLASAGVRVSALIPVKESLEDIYLKIKRGDRDES